MALLTTLDFTGQDVNLAQLKDQIISSGSITNFEYLHQDGDYVHVHGEAISNQTNLNSTVSSYVYIDEVTYAGPDSQQAIQELVVTVPKKSELATVIDYNRVTNIWVATQVEIIKLTPTGTIDTDNVSSIDSQLVDGNFNSLCYNNRVFSTTNLNFVGIDLGSPQDIKYVYIYWFSSYYDGDFKLQTSNDGTTWTDQTGTLTGEYQGSNQDPQTFALDNVVTARYIRPVVVSGSNAYYFVINEMELYQDDPNVEYSLIGTMNEKKITSKLANNKLHIHNKYPYEVQVKINYI